nr:hypothetical protein [Tanacetum cinerariifolium]
SKSVVIQDTLSTPKSKPTTSKTKLKGASSLTLEEQAVAEIMQALKESKKIRKRQPGTGGSNEGTGSKPGIPDESIPQSSLLPQVKELGDEQDSEHSDDDNDDVEKDNKDGDVDDEGDAHISDTQDADDEDVETESDEEDIYKYKIHVRKDDGEEMINAKVNDSDKGDEEITDVAKADAKKTSEAKDDAKTKLPPSSSILSINSLLEVKIQSEVPNTQSPSVFSVLVSMISKPTVRTLVQESPSTSTTTTLHPPSVSTAPYVPQQTTTPIPTPTITADAPTVTAAVPESNALIVVELRVAILEKDVSELKTVDHSSKVLAILMSHVSFIIDNYLEFKVEDVFQKELKKHTTDLIQKYSLQQFSETSKKQTPIVDLQQGSKKKPLIDDENVMDKGVADTIKDHKRKHDDEDDDDEDPPARPNHGKKTKRRRTKESESSKKPSSTKETPKGKALTKGSKTGKSASAKEPIEEPIAEVVMDDAGDDVAHDDNQPQDTSEPKTRKTLNPDWFKQPPRHPTPFLNETSIRLYLINSNSLGSIKWSLPQNPLTFNDLMATPIVFSKPPGHQTVVAGYFFNNVLEYLKTSDLEVTYTSSITKTKAARHGHLEEIVVKRSDQQLYKFKEAARKGNHQKSRAIGWCTGTLDGLQTYDVYRLIVRSNLKILSSEYCEYVELKKYTVDLIQKYSLQQIPELPEKQTPIINLEQESEKTPLDILKIKKEQAEKQKMPKFTIKSTDKETLKEDIPLDSVVVLRYEKRSKSENKGRVPIEMEVVLEQTQQGTSYEVLASAEGVEEVKRKDKIKGEMKEASLHLGINWVNTSAVRITKLIADIED